MKKNIDYNLEWAFIKECENNCHTSIAGKQRFIEFLHIIHKLPPPGTILDVGGNIATAKWFQTKYPNAQITILNKSKKELAAYPRAIEADAQSFKTKEKYDLVFAGEIIEHLYNPDGLICSCLTALKPKGYFVITTPNLANIYNRFFLLFGWSPGSYTPSIRYLTGNPFFPNKIGSFGIIGDHKSVFTWGGLYELLKLYDLKIIDFRGYSYGQEEKQQAIGDRFYEVPMGKLRITINNLLPKKLKEGMLFLCQAPANLDLHKVSEGLLGENIWEL